MFPNSISSYFTYSLSSNIVLLFFWRPAAVLLLSIVVSLTCAVVMLWIKF